MATEIKERLSQITTHWTNVIKAHDVGSEKPTEILDARQSILKRYGMPIKRYLLGATGDELVAEELAQEFAFRFVRGDLKNASPDKGRFRDYLKAVLRNIVNDYFRRKKKEKVQELLVDQFSQSSDPFIALEQTFNEHWREELINNTWCLLKEHQESRRNWYFTVLRFRADHPDLDSKAIAVQLSEKLPRPVSAAWVRQNLKRARTKFWSILLTEVTRTLTPKATQEEIENELADLRLLKYAVGSGS